MKVGILCGLLILTLDVSLFLTPAESFTVPISVSTGMAIIVALVKIKAIIVKVLLGLRAMGIDGFVWRRRRRRDTSSEILTSQNYSSSFHHEFLNTWNDLQSTVGKVIQFDLDECVKEARISSRAKTYLPWEKDAFPNYVENLKSQSTKSLLKDAVYSAWISRTLGSITGDPVACQVVLELSKKNRSSSSEVTETGDIIMEDDDSNHTITPTINYLIENTSGGDQPSFTSSIPFITTENSEERTITSHKNHPVESSHSHSVFNINSTTTR